MGTVLAVLGIIVVVGVIALVVFVFLARRSMRKALERQHSELDRYPAWAEEHGLAYTEVDNSRLDGLKKHMPFANFDSPGNFIEARHVFHGTVNGRKITLMQLTAYADPHPGSQANGALTVAAARLDTPAPEERRASGARGEPSIHVKGRYVTCYLGRPLMLARAERVLAHLNTYLDSAERR